MSTIGDRMRELRGTSSQREMAEAIGIKWNAWARYEAGGTQPGAEIITKICRVHAVSADWLLGLKEVENRRGDFLSVKATTGGIAIGGVGNRVSGTIVASGDVGHGPACRSCPYKKWGEKLRKQGLVIPGVK